MPRLQIPEAFEPLFEPRRYKVMYGGRGSGKSWSVARVLLQQGTMEPLRILCCREIMRTIADSVHRLLADQIEALGLQGWYTVTDGSIVGRPPPGCDKGAEFLFTGLRTIDAGKIKSYEGVDVAWVEEAQTLSEKSLDILIPTVRAERSELWFTLNPEMDSDAVYRRLVTAPPPDAFVRKVNWHDNPWFPAVLEAERQLMLARDPEEYRHIWEGEPRTVVEGAIYAREVTQLIEQRRFRAVPYDPRLLVHTIWDLGWNDQTSIIFAQRQLSEVRIIDYEEESFLRYDEWARKIKDKPYHYGHHWLPHDAESATQGGGGLSAQKQLKPLLGQNPKIVARPASVEHPIRDARMMWPRVYMDEEKCARLLECLKRFRRGVPETTGEPGSPVKDEYRHGADAFGYLATIVDKLTNEKDRPVPKHEAWKASDPGVGY